MRLAFLILLLLPIVVAAQPDSVTNDILTTSKFSEGLYKKFESFRTNSPDVTTGYVIRKDTSRFERYQLIDDRGKRITTVYGFSDGENLFINARTYCDYNYYVRLEVLGPISFFEDAKGVDNAVRSTARASRMALGIVVGSLMSVMNTKGHDLKSPGWLIYLDDNDGQPYLFDQRNLLSIFKLANPEMYKQLKAEPNKGDYEMLKRYVDTFNNLPDKHSKK